MTATSECDTSGLCLKPCRRLKSLGKLRSLRHAVVLSGAEVQERGTLAATGVSWLASERTSPCLGAFSSAPARCGMAATPATSAASAARRLARSSAPLPAPAWATGTLRCAATGTLRRLLIATLERRGWTPLLQTEVATTMVCGLSAGPYRTLRSRSVQLGPDSGVE